MGAISLFLARHLQDKGFARGFDGSFPPISWIIDPDDPTKLRMSVGVNYLAHEPRPPKPPQGLVGLVVLNCALIGPLGKLAAEAWQALR